MAKVAPDSVAEIETKGISSTSWYLSPRHSSVIYFYPNWCKCFKEPEEHDTRVDRHERRRGCCCLSCPPQRPLSRVIYFALVTAFFFLFWYGMDQGLAVDAILPLIILEITGISCGIILRLCKMPALLAPLLIGILLNNIPGLHFFDGLRRRHWIPYIRSISLCIILTRAGLELSPKQMKKLKCIVFAASLFPCLVESITCGLLMVAFFHSSGMPIAMCFAAGFTLGAVSPAVVVPGCLNLKSKGYGVRSGIPDLLIAAASFDDIVAIFLFSLCLNLVKLEINPNLPKSEMILTYAGLFGIPVGLLHGLLFGMILHFIPSSDTGSSLPQFRLVLLLLLNLGSFLMYDSNLLDWLIGASSLSTIITAFIASFGWRTERKYKMDEAKMATYLAHIWTLVVPMLFGTIGAEIDFLKVDYDTAVYIFLIIAVCIVVRVGVMFTVSLVLRAKWKERVFCALSWIPKATVQAALAPMIATEFKNTALDNEAKSVVLLAVTAILLTAPAGAIIISVLGPKLLRKDQLESDQAEALLSTSTSSETPEKSTLKSESEESLNEIKEALNVISLVN